MATTTTPQLWSHPFQFVVETTEGTIPAATATVGPPVKSLSIKKDGNWVDVGQCGPEDVIKLVQGQQSFESSVTFYCTNTAADETFFARSINAANAGTPAGTISETISFLFGFRLNAVVNYVFFKGSRAKSVALKTAIGQPHEITIEYVHTGINAPAITTNSVTISSTFNTGVVNDWLSGGAVPCTIIGVANAEVTEINLTINRNTSADYVLGVVNPHSSQPHARRVSGDFKTLHLTTTQETNYLTPTSGSIAIVLETGQKTITVTNCNIVTYSRDYGADDTDAIVEACGYKGVAVSIA